MLSSSFPGTEDTLARGLASSSSSSPWPRRARSAKLLLSPEQVIEAVARFAPRLHARQAVDHPLQKSEEAHPVKGGVHVPRDDAVVGLERRPVVSKVRLSCH
mmetsp:Transcript_14213/g.28144  ORF Transcript_14213/g.28144 Transcript_14213/m.28144 type:complete len:102 (-) Transcript_14213:877-1182(-)